MYNLYFPICAFMISLLINLAFFSKKRMTNKETKCYTRLILLNFLESSLAVIIVIMAICFGTLDIAYLTNRIDYVLIVLWVSQMFKYFVYITTNGEALINKVRKVVNVFNVVAVLLIFSTDITLINQNGIIDTRGTSTTVVTIFSIMYFISILVTFFISLKNKRKLGNKIVPMFSLILLFLLMVIIRKVYPEIVLISYIISYIDLIMLFTIENPDTKLIEEVVKSKESADNYNEEKTYFIFNTTQELKGPINKISNLINGLINKVEDKEINDELRVIEENVVNLNSILNSVLDISQVDSSRINMINNKYNIDILLKEIISNVKGKIDNNIDFRVDIDKNLPDKLLGDSIRLKQVLNTVLSNSIKYTSKGYIELKIDSLIKDDVCRLVIKIEDSGEGIKADKLNAIFKRNKNENDTNLINENDSSELNLVNVRKILNLMGGTLLINSNYGMGTKITVVLDQKIVKEENDNINKMIKNYQEDYKNKRILVIDENENNIKLVTKIFNGFGVKVDSACNVKECREKINNNSYSLILLDDTLENYNSFDIIKKIKKNDNFVTPIIALSKNNLLQYKDEYIEKGFDEYLQKPINKSDVKEILNKFFK